MRILKPVLGAGAVLAVIFVAAGMLLPRDMSVAQGIELDAPPAEVFPYIKSRRAIDNWVGADDEHDLNRLNTLIEG
jgi:hypothetical protein